MGQDALSPCIIVSLSMILSYSRAPSLRGELKEEGSCFGSNGSSVVWEASDEGDVRRPLSDIPSRAVIDKVIKKVASACVVR